ncbi:MAG: SUMF1/EgtB/PvdO family nonheme iron enzyme, partial [Nitrospira sp.]|nr:SUMF1/EgtB/PvdO family nonheme iron enzyme [Nitrospira sp.]
RTRVVRALAEALASHYPDGLVYIDGRDHRHESGSQEKLLRTVLQAFAPEASFPPALDTLVREFHYTLKGKKSCIVIDYLEGAKPFSLELETSGPQEEARPTAKAQYGKFRYGETQYGSVEDEETQGFYQYLEPPLGNLLLLIGDKQPFDSSACLALDLDDAMTRFPQPSNLQHDIYVSAAQVDERRVRPILKGLQAEGWTVWSERNVLAGDHWRKEIEQAIEAAKVHLVVLTADSLASRYVMEEVEFGIARGHVIPVILDRMAIPEILLDRQVVDLRDWTGNRKDGDWLRLIERLRSVLGSTTSKNVGRSPEGMVRIPKGPFLYGDEKREVTINHDYYMDVYPVTNGAYRKFIEGSGYENQTYWSEEGWQWRTSETITKPRFWDDERFNGPDQPVVGVSYYEAEAYAKWAGKRLPTEQEWEKAARGTDGRTYPWGEEFEADRCANSVKGEQRQTTPVGTFPEGASPFGCQDMAGNVWEWCASWYDAEQKFRVLRGGSWSNGDPEIFRCALRNYFNPRLRNFNFGFRCAQDAP